MNHLACSFVCLMLASGLAAFQMENMLSSRQSEASCCAQIKTKCAQRCTDAKMPDNRQCGARCGNSQCGPYNCGDLSGTSGEDSCCSDVKTKCAQFCTGRCDQECSARCGTKNSQCGPYKCSDQDACSTANTTENTTTAAVPTAATTTATVTTAGPLLPGCANETNICRVDSTVIQDCCGKLRCIQDPKNSKSWTCTAAIAAVVPCTSERNICSVDGTKIQDCCGKLSCRTDPKNPKLGVCTAAVALEQCTTENNICSVGGTVVQPCCDKMECLTNSAGTYGVCTKSITTTAGPCLPAGGICLLPSGPIALKCCAGTSCLPDPTGYGPGFGVCM